MSHGEPPPRPLFLLVEDSEVEAREIARILRPHGAVVWARTLEEASASMSAPIAAAIVDWKLPDGSGLTVVTALKAAFPQMPVLVLTAHLDPACVNRAHLLRAEYVCKPPSPANLTSFAERAVQSLERGADRGAIAEKLARAHGLSVSEREVVRLALAGVARRDLPVHLGVSENTTKTYVKRLLAKTGDATLDALVRRALSDALRRAPREG